VIERINDFVAGRYNGAGTTVGSFVRIHLWALAFLVAFSLVLPPKLPALFNATFPVGPAVTHAGAQKVVQKVTLQAGDQRAFLPSPFGKKRFRIAWISGSEGEYFPNTTNENALSVASLAVKTLPQVDGRAVGVDFYFLPSMRLGDIYFALLDALKTKPDMIVLTLNPVWVLNPVATHQWSQLDANASVALLTKPAAWPIGASLLSPSDLGWGLADSTLQVIRDKSSYNRTVQNVANDLDFLDESKLAAATKAQAQDRYQQLFTGLSVDFWFRHRLGEGGASTPEVWAKRMAQSNEGQSALNQMMLHAIATSLRNSKIPSYVYLSQVNSSWFATSTAFTSAVGGVERQLQNARSAFTAKNIHYQPLSATRYVSQQLTFVPDDPVHLRKADAIGIYLGDQLCQLAIQTGHRADCAGGQGGTGNG
jgi:hypothetical protein